MTRRDPTLPKLNAADIPTRVSERGEFYISSMVTKIKTAFQCTVHEANALIDVAMRNGIIKRRVINQDEALYSITFSTLSSK